MKLFFFLFVVPLLSVNCEPPARIAKKFTSPKLGLVTFSLHDENQLTKMDKQRVLDMHNALRNYLALGKETYSWDGSGGHTSMPSGANMQAMSWDDNLAQYAQNWANKCLGAKHSSMSGDPLLKDYVEGFTAESLSGDVTAQERDMYGEVQWWNYEGFKCRSDSNCGHYLAFANSLFNHLGCGFKKCTNAFNNPTYTLVCLYGGHNPTAAEDGVARKPYQHEYEKGAPCSNCQQGWDYCMGGGLCATKKQCESNNQCKCLHTQSECEGNGGTFDGSACTCTCPANKMGINCKDSCADTLPECGACDASARSAYFCQKTCGSCGKAKSAAYTWTYVARNAPNSENIVTRTTLEDPDAVASLRTPSGQPYCTNSAGNANCEALKARGYCNDILMKIIVKDACKLSCNVVCPKPQAPLTASDIDKELGLTGLTGGTSSGGPASGTDAATALNSLGLGSLSGLGDLSGFKVVRRRRR